MLIFWPRRTTSLGAAPAGKPLPAAAAGAGDSAGSADSIGANPIGAGASAGGASTTAAIGTGSAMPANGIGSSTAAIGTASGAGGGAGTGATLRSDLHCSQKRAPSSFSNPQNGHFVITL